jgi:hypothetical protein
MEKHENIISASIGNPDVSRETFSIYEKNGEVRFNAFCFLHDGYTTRETSLKNVLVTQKDMETLRKIFEDFNITDKQKLIEFDKHNDNIALEIGWQNGTTLKIEMPYNMERELIKYFTSLAAQVENAMPKQTAPAKLLSFKISQSGGNRVAAFFYHLREENGKVLLDAHYDIGGDEHRHFELESVDVPKADMETLQALCNEYALYTIKPPSEKDAFMREERDRPDKLIEAFWEDGHALLANSFLGVSPAFTIFFESLCDRVATPPAQGRLNYLYISSNKGGFYNLREYNGKILYSTVCKLIEDGITRDVNLSRVSATKEDMEDLCSICEKYAFAEKQQTYRPAYPSCTHKYYYEALSFSLTAEWENGARLRARTFFGSEEELWAFFTELTSKIEKTD